VVEQTCSAIYFWVGLTFHYFIISLIFLKQQQVMNIDPWILYPRIIATTSFTGAIAYNPSPPVTIMETKIAEPTPNDVIKEIKQEMTKTSLNTYSLVCGDHVFRVTHEFNHSKEEILLTAKHQVTKEPYFLRIDKSCLHGLNSSGRPRKLLYLNNILEAFFTKKPGFSGLCGYQAVHVPKETSDLSSADEGLNVVSEVLGSISCKKTDTTLPSSDLFCIRIQYSSDFDDDMFTFPLVPTAKDTFGLLQEMFLDLREQQQQTDTKVADYEKRLKERELPERVENTIQHIKLIQLEDDVAALRNELRRLSEAVNVQVKRNVNVDE